MQKIRIVQLNILEGGGSFGVVQDKNGFNHKTDAIRIGTGLNMDEQITVLRRACAEIIGHLKKIQEIPHDAD